MSEKRSPRNCARWAAGTLNRALGLVGRIDEVYAMGRPRVRRLANQCFFDKLLISVEDEPEVAGATFREPWATLLAGQFIQQMAEDTTNPDRDLVGRGLITTSLVPRVGVEPTLDGF